MDGIPSAAETAHHLRTAPRDGAHIGIDEPVLRDDEALGGVDLGGAIGDFEIQHLGRTQQPLGMLQRLEDLATIGTSPSNTDEP